MALYIDDGDWIPLFRKIRKHWTWEDPAALRFWIDLIMLANHHDGEFRFKGHFHHMKRGQVATTYKALAERNGWSRDRVKGCLALLEHGGSVVVQPRSFDTSTNAWTNIKSDTGFLLLTIVNYPVTRDSQQLPTAAAAAESAGIRQPIGSESAANRQRIDTSKKEEEGKEGEKGGGSSVQGTLALATPPPPPAGGGTEPPGKPGWSLVAAAEQPPHQPAPTAADLEQRTGKPEDIARSYRMQDPNVPGPNCLNHITRAIELGADPVKLHDSVIRLRERMKLWTICDLEVEKAASKGAAKPPAKKPPVQEKSSEQVHQEKALAFAEVDTKLAELPPEEVAAWTREAEAEAAAKKIYPGGLKLYVTTALRQRAAAKFGIKGV